MSSQIRSGLQCGSALAAALIALAGLAPAAQADVTISTDTTQNMNCVSGVCVPTATSAVLNVSDLESLLASGNVEVTTTGSGVQADNIDVDAALTWSNTSVLTVNAVDSISVQQGVSVTGTGGLTLNYGSGSTLSFGSSGNVTFQDLSSALTINGTSYGLVNSIAGINQAGPYSDIALAQSFDASGDGTYTTNPVSGLAGIFEGLGNTISNVSMNVTTNGTTVINYIGFFGYISGGDYPGTVRDFGLVNVNITGSGTSLYPAVVGALAGSVASGQVFGVWSSGTVTSGNVYAEVGGLLGTAGNLDKYPRSTIANSYSTATVDVTDGTSGGGFVGYVFSNFYNCYATGQVEGGPGSAVGGFAIGSGEGGYIEGSFATGAVSTGDGGYAGGLVSGVGDTKITNSYATGSVTGGQNAYVGGLFGSEGGGVTKAGKFTKSYSTGQVTGGTGSLVGGSVGYIDPNGPQPTFQDIYWDTDTSGSSQGTGNDGNVAGITGLTTSQFMPKLPKGLSKKYWGENSGINGGFPYLLSNPPP
jgi:hypothetical protein